MGYWGAGPFDNDDAADIVAGLMKPCRVVAYALTGAEPARSYYPAARVGVQVRLLAHGTDILGGPPLQLCLDALQRIRGDAEWLAGWRKAPNEIKAALDAEIRAVKLAMKKNPRSELRDAVRRAKKRKTRTGRRVGKKRARKE